MTVKKITTREQAKSGVDMFIIPKLECLGNYAIAPLLQHEFDTQKQEIIDVLILLNDYLNEEEKDER